jgi:hypothetical protein
MMGSSLGVHFVLFGFNFVKPERQLRGKRNLRLKIGSKK